MSDSSGTAIVQQLPDSPQATAGAADTDAEFRALWTDHDEARKRFLERAAAAEASGDVGAAKILREVAGTVLTLIGDMIAATGGAIIDVEERVGDLEEAGPAGGSSLMEKDAKNYIALFEQYLKLLDQLVALVPAGSDGDTQREVFATLRRLTEDRIEFTNEITVDDEPEEPDDDGDGADDDDDPDNED